MHILPNKKAALAEWVDSFPSRALGSKANYCKAELSLPKAD